MKFFVLIFCLIINSLAKPCLAYEITQNAEGDTIVILDGQNTSLQDGWQAKAQEILVNALSLTGVKYKYGGRSPETGFDCSGFVRYVFSQAANLSLPPTARAISQIGKTVSKDELQPGDLVFFNTLKKTFSHVGIYIGDHKFIHSPSSGSTVRVDDMQTSYWAKRYNGAQRLEPEAEKSVSAQQLNTNQDLQSH